MKRDTDEITQQLQKMIRDIDVNARRRRLKLVVNRGITKLLVEQKVLR